MESPFACPSCRISLRVENHLACAGCGTRYLGADGVAAFNDRGFSHGPILSKPDMEEWFAEARAHGYRAAIRDHLTRKDPEFARYISAPARTGGLALLDLKGIERVLDFGCAFGVLSLELVKRAAMVAALDVTRAKIQFLEIVKQQDDLETLFPVCSGDPLRLPFAEGSFDWVILNAVFEYLPQSIPVADVRAAHLLALQEVYRVLAPGGRLYLSTKNRYSYRLWLGERDHERLRFTSLMPRPLADRVSRTFTGVPYRTVTHSFGEYHRLLREAGFRAATFYWPFPSLQYPQRFVPLTDRRDEMLTALAEIKPLPGVTHLAWHLAARAGILPTLIPQYTILAEK